MWILVVAIIVLGIVLAIAHLLTNSWDEEPPIVTKQTCATYTGDNDKCEQECMMEAATQQIEYYDDEELDRYKGRTADSYTDEEAEQFREVMETMRPDEVKGWNRSLILRQIAMPDQIKDEAVMLME
mgnify:FL=1